MKIAELLIGFGAGMAAAVLIINTIHYDLYYEDEDLINPSEYKILIGPKDMPECSQEFPLSIWESMNNLQIWHWVTDCVEEKRKQ